MASNLLNRNESVVHLLALCYFYVQKERIKARLHQASASTPSQGCRNARFFSLTRMESLQNGLQPHSGATLFGSIDFNESYVTSVIIVLTLMLRLTLGVIGS